MNKIIHKFITYESPYFDKFNTISLEDFTVSTDDVLIMQLEIDNVLIFEIIYESYQEKFCFQAFYNKRRIQFIVLNKLSIDDIHEEYNLMEIIQDVINYLSSTNKMNYAYIDVLENRELLNVMKLYSIPSLIGIFKYNLYSVGNSYISFHHNLQTNEIAYIIINKEKFQLASFKYTQEFEYKSVVKEKDILNIIEKSIKEVNEKTSKDISSLFLYLI